jgi:hypothetical protein
MQPVVSSPSAAAPLVGRVTGGRERLDVSAWATRLLDLRARQLRVANAALLRALAGDLPER